MNNLKIINKSFNFGKVFLFLIVVGLLVGVVSGADDVDANVEKVKKEITSKEQKELDELGSTMHQLKNWRGEKSAIE